MTFQSLMIALAFMIGGATAPPTTSAGTVDAGPAFLQPLTPADIQAGRLHGVGCSWSQERDPRPRLIMADDRALAKIDGAVTKFWPAIGAKDVFPFTFDRWRAGDTIILVKDRGPSRGEGSETLVTKADLIMQQGPKASTIHGVKTCGS